MTTKNKPQQLKFGQNNDEVTPFQKNLTSDLRGIGGKTNFNLNNTNSTSNLKPPTNSSSNKELLQTSKLKKQDLLSGLGNTQGGGINQYYHASTKK